MIGISLKDQGITKEIIPEHFSVKEAVFPFNRFPGVDPVLGPEMKSTGEVMGIDADLGVAYMKAQMAAGQKLPEDGNLNILSMTQLLGCVAHAAFRLDKPYNKDVVVLGQGPVGLLFTSLLKNFGARNIIAADPLEYRLKTAREMGADYILNTEIKVIL